MFGFRKSKAVKATETSPFNAKRLDCHFAMLMDITHQLEAERRFTKRLEEKVEQLDLEITAQDEVIEELEALLYEYKDESTAWVV